ncbi:hypothetical protein HDZ31DRAFT_37003 [Schizophyllum fasciatum]
MSSRSAAGRKRLQTGQVQTLSPALLSPKTLFGFRSKSTDRRGNSRSPTTPYVHSAHIPVLRQCQSSYDIRSRPHSDGRGHDHAVSPHPPPSPSLNVPTFAHPSPSPHTSRSTIQRPICAEPVPSAQCARNVHPHDFESNPSGRGSRTAQGTHLHDRALSPRVSDCASPSPSARHALYLDDVIYSSPVSSPDCTPFELLAPSPRLCGHGASSSSHSLVKISSAASSASSQRSTPTRRTRGSGSIAASESSGEFVFPSGRSVMKPGARLGRKVPKCHPRDNFHTITPSVRSRTSTESPASDSRRHRAVSESASTSPDSSAPSIGIKPASVATRSPTSETFVFPTSRSRANPTFRPAVKLTPQLKLPIRRGKEHKLQQGHVCGHSPVDATPPAATSAKAAEPRQERERSIRVRVGEYLFDQNDEAVQSWERSTHELLRLLKPRDQPCFHDYGELPPMTVLDLGCGQGRWILDAARAWKKHGTQVIGFDLVDTTCGVWKDAAPAGLLDNVRLVIGNFLTRPLPFEDGTFDLVRMADLTYAIPFNKWEEVLREAKRVLAVGGRLELIDDEVLFPYSDATILSADTWTHDRQHPHRAFPPQSIRTSLTSVIPDIDVSSDTYTLYEDSLTTAMETSTIHAPSKPSPSRLGALRTASEEIETLFGYMVRHKLGLELRLQAFLFDALQRIFGENARETATMRLGVACPLHTASGLVLSPSTFISMRAAELELHATRHCRTVLKCRELMAEYANDVSNGEDVDDETISEALWDYAEFLLQRFDIASTRRNSIGSIKHDALSQRQDRRDSTGSVDADIDALVEYQSTFRDFFAVPPYSANHEYRYPDLGEVMHGTNEGQDQMSTELTHVRTFRIFECVKNA